uniref:Conjugal transfer protein TraG n=1 Tax=Prevotella sp. GTC17259 TaxID=3236795 RepID=A0AB33J2S2_9BACT
MFVGAVSDNFDERIDQKIFHAEIVVDSAKVSAEMKAYQPIPVIANFINEDGSDNLKETIEANYRKVKQEILSLVDSEIHRIKIPLPCPISFQTNSATTDRALWMWCDN